MSKIKDDLGSLLLAELLVQAPSDRVLKILRLNGHWMAWEG